MIPSQNLKVKALCLNLILCRLFLKASFFTFIKHDCDAWVGMSLIALLISATTIFKQTVRQTFLL